MATYDTFQTPTASQENGYAAVRDGRNPSVAGLANPNNATRGGMEPSSNSFTPASPNVSQYRANAQRTESAIDRENRTNPYSVMNQANSMEQQRKQREMAAQQRRNPQIGQGNPSIVIYGDPFGTQQPGQQMPYGTPDPQQQWGNQEDLQQQGTDPARYQEAMRKRQEAYRQGAPQRYVNRYENPYMQPFAAGFIPGFPANYQNPLPKN